MVPYGWLCRWIYLRHFISYTSQSKSLSVEWKSLSRGLLMLYSGAFCSRKRCNNSYFLVLLFKASKCWTVLCNNLRNSTVTQNINQILYMFTALFPSHLIKLSAINTNQMAVEKYIFCLINFQGIDEPLNVICLFLLFLLLLHFNILYFMFSSTSFLIGF